jgi:GT2 family glycosyltransferase
VADQLDSLSRDATPSVIAFVVAHYPGDWFEETLESLATQDYTRISVVVIDGAGDPTLGGRVHAVLPNASVLDASDTDGFSAAADAILDTDADPAFVLICHDDIALASDAVRLLVTESMRSSVGVAGPKLVDWDRPDRLQHVAYSVDRFGAAADVVDSGELDQEQYDSVADVFALPSACLLVHTGLFRTLRGFDPAITRRGEEIDFCWRAHLVGARVMVVPDARVRHREALVDRTGIDDIRRTRARHQIRTVAVTGSRLSLVFTLPLMALLMFGEAAVALVTGRFSHVRDIFAAWVWNLRRVGEIRARRRELRPLIRARHADVRALQETGSVRVNAFVRGQIGRRDADNQLRSLVRTGTSRIAAVVAAAVALFVIFGSRSLVTGGIPAVGDFLAFGDSPGALVDEWWHGWRHRDLGSPGVGLSGVAVLGGLASLMSGALGFVRLLWVLGPIALGLVGAWRMLSVTGSRRAQLGALLAYTIVPLPWASLASASIDGLYAYAVAPWMLAAFLHGQAASPFRSNAGPWRGVLSTGLGLGVSVGVAALFAPSVVLLAAPMVVGLLIAGLLTGRPAGSLRMCAVGAVGAVVLAPLALPQLFDHLAVGFSWTPFADGRSGAATDLELIEILGFAVGPRSVSPLSILLVVPLALPLLVGRSWRFGLAARGWMVALSSWGMAWAAAWGALPFGLPDPALVVAPAAAAVALVAGSAVSVAEHDMRRAGFGWRQALLPVAVVAAFLAALPTLALIESGRWDMPRGDFTGTVPFADSSIDGSYRVLWIAEPANVPGGGRPLNDTLAWAVTLDGLPLITDRGIPPDDGSSDLVIETVNRALDGDTMRLGRTLGGLGIRYVVVLDRLAPAPFSTADTAVPAVVAEALGRQLDLRRLEGVNTAMDFYVNTEWTSVRAAASDGFDDGRETIADLASAPLTGTVGVLEGRDDRLTDVLPDGTELYLAQTHDTRWRLVVDGDRAGRRRSLEWATAFLPDRAGTAVLTYDTPWWRQAAMLVQIVAFSVALGATLRRRIGALR